MNSKYFVPANKPLKTTKHNWWHYRWLEGRATLGACRIARQRLIDEAVYEGWTSIDTSCD